MTPAPEPVEADRPPVFRAAAYRGRILVAVEHVHTRVARVEDAVEDLSGRVDKLAAKVSIWTAAAATIATLLARWLSG